jgi:hypothetical protein
MVKCVKLYIHSGCSYCQYLVADINNQTASTYMCTSTYKGLSFVFSTSRFLQDLHKRRYAYSELL